MLLFFFQQKNIDISSQKTLEAPHGNEKKYQHICERKHFIWSYDETSEYFFPDLAYPVCLNIQYEMMWGTSNEYPPHVFVKKQEKYQYFSLENVPYLELWS